MGNVAEIDHERFPEQDRVGWRVQVIFHKNDAHSLEGECVRDDVAEPFVTILRLDDGRHVLSTECQYRFLTSAAGERRVGADKEIKG